MAPTDTKQVVHRPGPLRQTNKAHKGGRHRKSTNDLKTKLKAAASSVKLSRNERINQALQNRKLKREKATVEKKKTGSLSAPPLLVGILDLHLNSCQSMLQAIIDSNDPSTLSVREESKRVIYVTSKRLKMRFKMIALNAGEFDECLDIVKSLDILLLLHRPKFIENDDHYESFQLMRAIHMNCLPSIVHVIDGLTKDIDGKSTSDIMKAKRMLRRTGDKLHSIESSQDFLQLFNIIGNCKRQRSQFKDSRPIIIPDKVEQISDSISFTGFVGRRTLDVNTLVHIVGFGEYQIEKVEILPDIVSLMPQSHEESQVVQTLLPNPSLQASLDEVVEEDMMDCEQTWPAAEEIEEKGVVSEDEDMSAEEEHDAAISNNDEDEEGEEEEEDDETAMKNQEMFPDEIDTPKQVPARVRFARYRGLKSFRTSLWDPRENLPSEYSKIVQFQNFKQTQRRLVDQDEPHGANPGQYVRVHIANVPQNVIVKIMSKPLPPILVGMLKYERKMTVMNFLIKKLPENNHPIRSKDELIFYVGFRKFKARPLFTNHSLSSKFKYERFLRDDVAMVATMYAPTTFPPAPVMVFRQKQNGEKELIATGSVLDSNPYRLIIKRIRLSGHPFKIYSRSAVVRFMFFNADDVHYFKPVELVTRYNRRGHITEPIGTHGHMKCTFDKKIRSDDCIFMNLYKRVFPKWNYVPICDT